MIKPMIDPSREQVMRRQANYRPQRSDVDIKVGPRTVQLQADACDPRRCAACCSCSLTNVTYRGVKRDFLARGVVRQHHKRC